MSDAAKYPPVADYGMVSDCRSVALISTAGGIDWCCMPRFDASSVFGRMLDWDRGGHCTIGPSGEGAGGTAHRRYLDEALVLETGFRTAGGEARLLDFMPEPGGLGPAGRSAVVRIVEGVRGACELELRVAPRFDYGAVDPWIRHHGAGTFSAMGGDDGLVISSDASLEQHGRAELARRVTVRQGDRVRLVIAFARPEEIEGEAVPLRGPDPDEVDRRLEEAVDWWRNWSSRLAVAGGEASGAMRSAILLKGLMYEPTGAIAAAPTTSLPESVGTGRSFDYRYSWIRDSALAARSLAQVGAEQDADAFRRFVERSAAGNANDLQTVFGIAGERRLEENRVESLEGYRGDGDIVVGNAAARQRQLDSLGYLVEQSWRWYLRGQEPDDDYWRFIVDLVDTAAACWREPDHGIWEWPEGPRHFVHSKVMCWVALDRGLELAERCMRKAPERRWRRERDAVREAIETHGYDPERGVFRQVLGEPGVDAALLRLPMVGFVEFDDERMLRTTDAIRADLAVGDGVLIRRYRGDDGMGGDDLAFVPAVFWLAEVLARQGRREAARRTFDAGVALGNELGLFAEEYDPADEDMQGNFPQALSHFAHLEAVLAFAEVESGASAGGIARRD